MGSGFLDDMGSFRIEHGEKNRLNYFPLAAENGVMASITPELKGDLKRDQNSFVLPPASEEDLRSGMAGRNFWCRFENGELWSAAGMSAAQIAEEFTPAEEKCIVEAGLLWHRTVRENRTRQLRAAVTSWVPSANGTVEIMQVILENCGEETLRLTPTAAIPLYGRSADNLRDHRHVTSLLNRAESRKEGVILTPTYSFDERGHTPNQRSYFVFGITEDGKSAEAVCADLDRYTGEGSLIMPEWVAKELPGDSLGGETAGKETIGALRFPETELRPGEKREYDILVGTAEDKAAAEQIAAVWLSLYRIRISLEETKLWWDQVNPIRTHTGDSDFDNILRWI